MSRRCRKADYQSSDDSDYPDGEDTRYDTDPMEADDDDDQLKDVGEMAQLFADNEHPPEYYMQQLSPRT
jgi:hypothetical protein